VARVTRAPPERVKPRVTRTNLTAEQQAKLRAAFEDEADAAV
jgi:hypothetical protein